MIIIYFTFIYSASPTRKQIHATLASTTTTTSASATSSSSSSGGAGAGTGADGGANIGQLDDEFDLDQLTEEKVKIIKDKFKELAKDLVFDIKGQPNPTTSTNTKAFVPRAMLEEYIKMRDSVREIIPDDRDFYGKININDLDQTHEEFWSAVYNKYGSYDVQVDMGPSNEGLESRRFNVNGVASHIAHVNPISKFLVFV